jgi:hypothetical protein
MDHNRIVGQLVNRCKRYIENVFEAFCSAAEHHGWRATAEAEQQQAVNKCLLEQQQSHAGYGPSGAALPDEAQGAPKLGGYEAAKTHESAVTLALESVEM